MLRDLSIWTGVAAVLLLVYTYRTELGTMLDRVSSELLPGYVASSEENELVIAASSNGHFYANGKANGKRVRFLVDTGASETVLSPQAASRIGVNLTDLKFTNEYETANGIGLGATYRLQTLEIGSFTYRDFKISINKAKMSESLLGISFLKQLRSYEFLDGKLYLRK